MAQTSIIIESFEEEEYEGDGPSFIEREDLDDNSEFGCCFPGECCMPGPHRRSECCTPEMIEATYEAGEA